MCYTYKLQPQIRKRKQKVQMTVNKCLDLSVKYSVDLPYFEKKKLYHSITLRLYVLFVSRLEY